MTRNFWAHIFANNNKSNLLLFIVTVVIIFFILSKSALADMCQLATGPMNYAMLSI